MGQIKRLSANEVMRITGVANRQCKKVAWHTSEVIVKRFIPLKDYCEIIEKILKDCETPDGAISVPIIDFAIKINVISYFAFVDLPDDPTKMFEVVYCSDLYETIYKNSNPSQIDSIVKSVYKSIANEG